MSEQAGLLIEFKKESDFLVCIDSDGCAFDTMEIKHKECFIPNTINEWGLQAISKYLRETAEFVNLYSRWRGINRYPALVKVFDLLEERDEVKQREFNLPDISSLRKWVTEQENFSDPALEKVIKETEDPVLLKTMKWSKAVNETIARIVHNIPPFPYVRKSLEKIAKYADTIVVSATPIEALIREWSEHDMLKYIKVIAGQEMGSKKQCIELAKEGKYDADKVLMIGDAIGDLQAARSNGVLFYPIIPGNEEKSWKRFYDEAFEIFLRGEYKGDYENNLVSEFEVGLPAIPPWKSQK